MYNSKVDPLPQSEFNISKPNPSYPHFNAYKVKYLDQTPRIYFLVQFRCQNRNQHQKIPSKRYQYHAHRLNRKLCSGAIILPFDILCSSCSILCSCSRVNSNCNQNASLTCYVPCGHAMRPTGMLCTSRACNAPRGHAVRLTGMLCSSWACYEPRWHAGSWH